MHSNETDVHTLAALSSARDANLRSNEKVLSVYAMRS
eukprot:COSAG02_NODE_17116_length_1027_cov_1.446121_3_plen_36_part_01